MSASLEFSIIVPTYQEAKNLPALAERIAAVQFTQPFEVLLMDDNSTDGTPEVVEQLRQHYPWLKLIVNCDARDLSRAIISGFEHAQYPIVITLDADLSHPPEKIPAMLAVLMEPNVEMVIGSRYVQGGSVDDKWPRSRILISRLSALLARPLTPVKDPLSGFVAMKKEVATRAALNPIGWKIGLEIIVKSPCRNVREIPIHFSERVCGESKLNARQGLNYLHHLLHLFAYKYRLF